MLTICGLREEQADSTEPENWLSRLCTFQTEVNKFTGLFVELTCICYVLNLFFHVHGMDMFGIRVHKIAKKGHVIVSGRFHRQVLFFCLTAASYSV
jgi:hypothetical protein